MALLTIRGEDGKSYLIHSSQIGPQYRPPRSTGDWHDVWDQVEADPSRTLPAKNSAGIPSNASAGNLAVDDHYTCNDSGMNPKTPTTETK